MSDSTRTAVADPPIRYEIRYIPMPSALRPKILPFVEAALATVGLGSVAADENGLQLTAPVDVVHNLVATIKGYVDAADDPAFIGRVPYNPAIIIFGFEEDLRPAIATLGILPPEMRADWLALPGVGGALLFSGPNDRKTQFDSIIRPYMKDLIPRPTVNRLYVPCVEFSAGDANLIRIVDSLGLRPADMRCTFEKVGNGGRLMFSGPAERAAAYAQEVLPNIRALTGLLNPEQV